mmetsp:Transcript_22461/g.49099  ORF Transcript_22461/g.49099 Transcript_22461/m.49099 type:complete len:501 (+) Transcript_22461:50-1552(+)
MASAGSEEYGRFVQLRKYVKHMQKGTPLLVGIGGDDMSICTVRVSEDLERVEWQSSERSSRGGPQSVRIKDIDNIVGSTPTGTEDEYMSIKIKLKSGTLELVCATVQDYTAWREGFKLLTGTAHGEDHAAPGQPPAEEEDEQSDGDAAEREPKTLAEFKARYRQQKELIETLRGENRVMREISERKESTIQQLLKDLKQSSRGDLETYTKTHGSSRESENNLADRKITVLQSRVAQLEAEVVAKTQTISELLMVLQNTVARQTAVQQMSTSMPALEVGSTEPTPRASAKDTSFGFQPPSRGAAAASLALQDDFEDANGYGEPEPRGSGSLQELRQMFQGAAETLDEAGPSPTGRPPARHSHHRPMSAADVMAAVSQQISPAGSAKAAARPQTAPSPAKSTTIRSPVAAAKASSPAVSPGPKAAPAPVPKAASPAAADGSFAEALSGMSGDTAARVLEQLDSEFKKLDERKKRVETLSRVFGLPQPDWESADEEDDGFPLR